MDPLDNIMWHSLNGFHASLALGDAHARRFPSDVGPFGAVPDQPTSKDYAALRELIGASQVTTLFRGDVAVPVGWDVLGTINGVQMVGPTSVEETIDSRIITLDVADVPEMMALTSRTKPGPFAERTIELGTYLGIRIDDRLVSMAGQRAQTNEHVEISAVCTDDAYVGQGLGRALIGAQVATIINAGKLPMLHTSAGNARAIALYEFLGFQHRRTVTGVIMRAPA